MTDEQAKILDQHQQRFTELDEELQEFMTRHAAVLEDLRSLAAERNDSLKDYTKFARGIAQATPGVRGVVDVAGFGFQKKARTVIDPGKLVETCPEAAAHGVFIAKVDVTLDDVEAVREHLQMDDCEVVVDKDKVADLVNQKRLSAGAVEEAAKHTPLTPSRVRGPKDVPVP